MGWLSQELVVKDLVLLLLLGMRPVLVHGGGPEINKWLAKMDIVPNFSPAGLRVTDADTMDVRFPRCSQVYNMIFSDFFGFDGYSRPSPLLPDNPAP